MVKFVMSHIHLKMIYIMKIVNVTPGLISIPPNGWGAIEKIIWEIHTNLLALGHDSQIKYLDDVNVDDRIVHIHVANLANLAYERGIPYYFTMHDHHSYLYGKESALYKENLLAIKHAKHAFVPAKYLVDYFEGIPTYFSHGVNTEYFIPNQYTSEQHKLLCVANNGFASNPSEDRKGFGYAIEVAKHFNLPITIAGPSNNKKYFEKYPSTYEGLTIVYDLTEEQLKELYQTHSIFLHFSILEAGHPNLTLLEAMASGLPVIGTFEENNSLDGMKVVQREVNDDTLKTVREVILHYSKYKLDAIFSANILSWKNRTIELIKFYKDEPKMKEQLINSYNNIYPLYIEPKHFTATLNINYIDGAYAEVHGEDDVDYIVDFIDKKTGAIEYSTTLKNSCWAKVSKKYFIDWKILLKDSNGHVIKEYNLDFTNKKVYIALESKSLGDTLAWIPYVEEFRIKHKCQVICSTFWNNLFKETYSNIEFIKPGKVANNIVAMYCAGVFYDNLNAIDVFKHPVDPMSHPLQQTCSDILGLDFKEIKPLIRLYDNIEKEKIVTIAVHSTSQAKYWNNNRGWQEVVDYVKSLGYKVILLSTEENGYMGNSNPKGVDYHPKGKIEYVIKLLQKSVLFIGISSGLSWLSWACNTPVCIISGFTEKFNEFECIRICPEIGKCTGCYNKFVFDKGDWNWCPEHKYTPKQFECTKTITGENVINRIKQYL